MGLISISAHTVGTVVEVAEALVSVSGSGNTDEATTTVDQQRSVSRSVDERRPAGQSSVQSRRIDHVTTGQHRVHR